MQERVLLQREVPNLALEERPQGRVQEASPGAHPGAHPGGWACKRRSLCAGAHMGSVRVAMPQQAEAGASGRAELEALAKSVCC